MQAKKTSKGKEKKLLRKEVESDPSHRYSGRFCSKLSEMWTDLSPVVGDAGERQSNRGKITC